MKRLGAVIYGLFCIGTAMVGHTIHHSLFWSVVDFFFTFLAWAKWLICHQVNLGVIKQTFSFFLS